MDDNILNDFKNDLRELLKKYDADIYIELNGDTHGLDSALIIDIDNKEVMRFHDGSMSHYDIK